MQIEEGKRYNTIHHGVIGPMHRVVPDMDDAGDADWWTWSPASDNTRHWWTDSYLANNALSEHPAPASPVRRRTVTEIVPGTYGPVHVVSPAGECVRLQLTLEVLTAAELRHAATIFTALAEALEDSGK